jgi:DNA-binding transcriptional ArsR family regulator
MMTPVRDMEPLAREATALLKALGHPIRLILCCALRQHEMSVGQIETEFGLHQPRLSRELGHLREEGILLTRREGKTVFYRLSDRGRAGAMVDAICAVMTGAASLDVAPQTATTGRPPALAPNPPAGCGAFAQTRFIRT